MQSEFFDDEEFDTQPPTFQSEFGPLEQGDSDNYFGLDLPAPRRQLRRSRPPIDFSMRSSIGNYPSSQMSGSTLQNHSRQDSSPFMFAHKAASSNGLPSRLPVELIASLDPSELLHNPHYCRLRKNYNYQSQVLAMYLGKELRVDEPRAARSGPIFQGPNMLQGVCFSLIPDIR